MPRDVECGEDGDCVPVRRKEARKKKVTTKAERWILVGIFCIGSDHPIFFGRVCLTWDFELGSDLWKADARVKERKKPQKTKRYRDTQRPRPPLI